VLARASSSLTDRQFRVSCETVASRQERHLGSRGVSVVGIRYHTTTVETVEDIHTPGLPADRSAPIALETAGFNFIFYPPSPNFLSSNAAFSGSRFSSLLAADLVLL
jgi:hypothetical protein